MLKSVRETRKLFRIEGIREGEVNVETSQYLLSLPKHEQIKVLTEHLGNLREDLADYKNPALQGSNGKYDHIGKIQLEILIEVIERLLSRI